MNLTDLTYLLPELILVLAAALVFTLDLIWGRRSDSTGMERALPFVSVGGLLVAALGVIPSLGGTHHVATMLVIDPFAIFFKLLAIIGIAIVILTASSYMRRRTPYSGEFYALLLIVALASCVAVSASNLVMVYVGMEFLSITSYVLVGYLRTDVKSGEGAIKYFLFGATASAVMLYGMSLLFGATGTTDLQGVANALGKASPTSLHWLTTPAIVLLLAGFGFKASLVPFHQWVPDTYEGAPTPVTAFLSTISKATGFAILTRVFLIALGLTSIRIQWTAILMAISVVTMTVGNLTALRQTNIKRMLAYSSIAQAGYMVIGLAAMLTDTTKTFTGLNGVLIYLFAYLFTNVGAFAVVTAVEDVSGKTTLQDYAGLARRSPFLAALLFVFLASLAGIPPTGGFVGKFFVFGAAVQSQLWVLLFIAAVNSVIAAFYYLNVVRYMFFTPVQESAETVSVTPMLGSAIGLTATVTLLLGIFPTPLINWATLSARTLLSSLR